MVQSAEQIAATEGITAKSARAIAKTQREERRAKVAALLQLHHTYIEIADRLGCSPGTVANDVTVIRRGWKDRAGAAYDTFVAEEIAKLDALERRVLPKALAGNTEDGGPSLWAVDRALAIMDRRAKLLGLDRPAKVDVSGTVKYKAALDAEIEELIEQFRANDTTKAVLDP